MSLTVQQLLQRQALRRDLWQRASGGRPAPRPCIALSRLPSSGGATLGLDVAKALDFEFFGIEIVDRMAREQGLQHQLAEALDEHVRSGIDRYLVDAFRAGAFLESDYLRALVRTVRSIGESGGAVLLGRGAPYILPPERTLRVLVVAPKAARIERLAKAQSLTLEQATRELEREHDERRHFLQHHFHVDPDDASLYDLAVNTTNLTREAASELVVSAYRARFGAGAAARAKA
jgi:cytidylate kinase